MPTVPYKSTTYSAGFVGQEGWAKLIPFPEPFPILFMFLTLREGERYTAAAVQDSRSRFALYPIC